ncbi:hypothetical protein Tco_0848212 [Tanacetum coccineum]
MPLAATMLPPLQAAIAAGTSGEAAPPNPQTDHDTVTEPVHQTASPRDHGSPSPRPTPTTPAAPLHEPVSKPPRPIPTSSDPHVESSSKNNDSIPDSNVAHDPLGGSFFASPSRSTAAPPEGTTSGGATLGGATSGGAADPHNLTALYTLVSEQGKKIRSLESKLYAHKLLFKDVMGKLVKRVKFLESKLKARGRNVILTQRCPFLMINSKMNLEQHDSKKSKYTESQKTYVPAASRPSSAGVTPDDSSHPDVTHDTSVDPPVAPTPSFATPVSRRKSLATRKMPSSEVDLNAPDTFFIKVLSDDDSADIDDDTNPLFWHAFAAAWEVVPTGLGDVNALYFTDKSSKYFTH